MTLMENVSVRLLRGEARRAPEILGRPGQVTMFLSKTACNDRPTAAWSLAADDSARITRLSVKVGRRVDGVVPEDPCDPREPPKAVPDDS